MAEIVLVHGIDQQQKSADKLESAWLPALAAITPRAFRSAESCSRALRAPRSLNEPVRWRLSNLQ